MTNSEDLTLAAGLQSRNDTLLDDLVGTLDVAAGLADALLPRKNNAIADDLGDLLDLDAGLAAVLPTSRHTERPPEHNTDQASSTDADADASPDNWAFGDASQVAGRQYRFESLAAVALLGRAATPETRLRLRTGPSLEVLEAMIDAIALALLLSRIDYHDSIATPYSKSDHSIRSINHAQDIDQALTLAQALTRALSLGPLFQPGGDASIAGKRAQRVALELSQALLGTLQASDPYSRLHLGLSTHLDREMRLARLGGLTYRIELQGDAAAARAVWDDFTRANLRQVELRGLELGGVRWSRAGTTWPPTWISEIEVNSDPADDDPNVLVVRGGRRRADSEMALV
ncbi:hypothetical protein [Cryptosporangium japonicum]|uniref:Uncharacterized protein n=1 Tax=Cryptosporangium japonicum TaxID=80872 RepID=A0ABP3E9B4_9ACTN